MQLFPVEIKTRVTGARVQHDEERVKELDEEHGSGRSHDVQSSSPNVHKMIEHDHERVQLLHHCVVFGSKVGIFLIGKKDGDLIDYVGLAIEEDLAKSYEMVLETIYNDVLKCYYEKDVKDGLNHLTDEETKRLASSIRAVDGITDRHTFEDRLCLHRTITDKENLPLPNANTIPLICSEWNTNKPGGDQVTQMAWELN